MINMTFFKNLLFKWATSWLKSEPLSFSLTRLMNVGALFHYLLVIYLSTSKSSAVLRIKYVKFHLHVFIKILSCLSFEIKGTCTIHLVSRNLCASLQLNFPKDWWQQINFDSSCSPKTHKIIWAKKWSTKVSQWFLLPNPWTQSLSKRDVVQIMRHLQ